MITKFTNYIVESRKSLDALEMLNPGELGWILIPELRKRKADLEYIQDLLDVGCPIEFRDRAGWTPLHQASYDGKIEIMEFLISKGADVNSKENRDWTPLHLASSNRRLKSIGILLSNGAKVDVIDDRGDTPWDLASDKIRLLFPELNPDI